MKESRETSMCQVRTGEGLSEKVTFDMTDDECRVISETLTSQRKTNLQEGFRPVMRPCGTPSDTLLSHSPTRASQQWPLSEVICTEGRTFKREFSGGSYKAMASPCPPHHSGHCLQEAWTEDMMPQRGTMPKRTLILGRSPQLPILST